MAIRSKNHCILCKKVCSNEERYGKLFENNSWKVHHYCLVVKFKILNIQQSLKFIFIQILVIYKCL